MVAVPMTEQRVSCLAHLLTDLAIVRDRDVAHLNVLVNFPDGTSEVAVRAGPALGCFHHFGADNQVNFGVVLVVHT